MANPRPRVTRDRGGAGGVLPCRGPDLVSHPSPEQQGDVPAPLPAQPPAQPGAPPRSQHAENGEYPKAVGAPGATPKQAPEALPGPGALPPRSHWGDRAWLLGLRSLLPRRAVLRPFLTSHPVALETRRQGRSPQERGTPQRGPSRMGARRPREKHPAQGRVIGTQRFPVLCLPG